jgi:hypothetical protein
MSYQIDLALKRAPYGRPRYFIEKEQKVNKINNSIDPN